MNARPDSQRDPEREIDSDINSRIGQRRPVLGLVEIVGLAQERQGRGPHKMVNGSGGFQRPVTIPGGSDYPIEDTGKPMRFKPMESWRTKVSRFRDWLYEHIFLPEKKKWAEDRVMKLVEERKEIYGRLMDEIKEIEDEVKKNGNR